MLSTIQILRVIGIIWNVHLLILFGLDRFFAPIAPLPTRYFVLNFTAALVYLLLVSLPFLERLTTRLILLLIFYIGITPMLIQHNIQGLIPAGPTLHSEGMLLRMLPVQLLALILAAWHYKGWQVFLIACAMSALMYPTVSDFFNLSAPPQGLSASAQLPIGQAGRQAPVLAGGARFYVDTFISVIRTIFLLTIGIAMNYFITHLRRQQDAIASLNRELRAHASTLEQLTVSRERNRMARELHDTLTHTLSALTIQLETMQAYQEKKPERVPEMLENSLKIAREGVSETRRALTSLRANPLEDLGLTLAIRELAEATAEKEGLDLDLAKLKIIKPIMVDVEQTIYGVAQEAIANVEFHADATLLTVSLYQENQKIILEVRDDGRGFDLRQAHATGHYGLKGLQERAVLIGAELFITSQNKQGTSIRLEIPSDEYSHL